MSAWACRAFVPVSGLGSAPRACGIAHRMEHPAGVRACMRSCPPPHTHTSTWRPCVVLLRHRHRPWHCESRRQSGDSSWSCARCGGGGGVGAGGCGAGVVGTPATGVPSLASPDRVHMPLVGSLACLPEE